MQVRLRLEYASWMRGEILCVLLSAKEVVCGDSLSFVLLEPKKSHLRFYSFLLYFT